MSENVLEVEKLCMYYRTKKGVVRAVDNINFQLKRGDALALVGESGCGKSSLAKALIRLLPRNIDTYRGSVVVDGRETMDIPENEYRREVRWKTISMVFQGALNSLNPVLTVGFQVAEPLIIHEDLTREEPLERAAKMIKMVGIPESYIDRYPFELSGGMKQRSVLAMSLINNPRIVILDEPTSALDVITQANIMNLLKQLRRETDISFILITHDIAVSSELADSVGVMYAGEIVEIASAEEFYSEPAHPYSQLLLSSVPTLKTDKELKFIEGSPPSLIDPPHGCRFHPRCPQAMDICRESSPQTTDLGHNHYVRCWLHREEP